MSIAAIIPLETDLSVSAICTNVSVEREWILYTQQSVIGTLRVKSLYLSAKLLYLEVRVTVLSCNDYWTSQIRDLFVREGAGRIIIEIEYTQFCRSPVRVGGCIYTEHSIRSI